MSNPPEVIPPVSPHSFLYQAQTHSGQTITGSIEAVDLAAARLLLESMQLTVMDLQLDQPARRRGTVGESEFLLFNQQLAYLTQAGLPVESGLRLIAAETHRPGLSRAVQGVADDLARGKPLGEAFESRRGQFPRLYGRLIDAGVAAGNLPGMLFNIGRHLELVSRLRGAVMRAVAYPAFVLGALALVLGFLSFYVIPQFTEIYSDFDAELPRLTVFVIHSSVWAPWVFGGIVAALLLWPVLWRGVQMAGLDTAVADGFVMPLPLIGPVLRHGLIARWCDTVRLCVEGGLDLPRAMDLAGEAIGSPSLKQDGRRMQKCLSEGHDLPSCGRLSVIPPTVVTTIDLAARQNQLASALDAATELHRQQAESRVGAVNVVLLPAMIVLLGLVVGGIVMALFLPLICLMQSVM